MNGYGLTYRLIVCSGKIDRFKICITFRTNKKKEEKMHSLKNSFLFARKRKATSHTRLRAHDQYTSSTLIGGKGGAGPSSLDTMHEGPTEHVNARWM
jgi:hypothetical protein